MARQTQSGRRRNVNKGAGQNDPNASPNPAVEPVTGSESSSAPVLIESFDSITLTLPNGSKETLTLGADGRATTTILPASGSPESEKPALGDGASTPPNSASVTFSPGEQRDTSQNSAGTYSMKAFRRPPPA